MRYLPGYDPRMSAELTGGASPVPGTVVLRQSHAQREGLFGGLVAVFVLAFARGFPAAQTTGGRISITILCAAVIVVLTIGWLMILRHPPRLEISARDIRYTDGKGMVTTLTRQSGGELRFVTTGSGRYRSRGLMVSGSATVVPLPFFSAREVREQTVARGWLFPSARATRR
jgi:hypothetical protein